MPRRGPTRREKRAFNNLGALGSQADPELVDKMTRVLARLMPFLAELAEAEGWQAVLNSLSTAVANLSIDVVGLPQTLAAFRESLAHLPTIAANKRLYAAKAGGNA